jgi:hypothetical protein
MFQVLNIVDLAPETFQIADVIVLVIASLLKLFFFADGAIFYCISQQ